MPILRLLDFGWLRRRNQYGLGLVEEGLRFGVFGPLREFHDLAEAIQQGRGSVRVAELVLDHRAEGHVRGEGFAELFGIQPVRASQRLQALLALPDALLSHAQRVQIHANVRRDLASCLRSTQRQAAFN